MSNMQTTLFKKDSKGIVREWRITINYPCQALVIEHGTKDGKMVEKIEKVKAGKAGRSVGEQLELQYRSRINKKLDGGYVEGLGNIKDVSTNNEGLLRPMLAHPYDNVKNIDYNNAYCQPKFDGHRCLITKQNGELIAYSRNGKIINSIGHILDDMSLPEGVTVDGELYIHGMSLQNISSLVRKPQEDSKQLRYVAYDVISDHEYGERLQCLLELYLGWEHDSIKIAPTWPCESFEKAVAHFIEFRKNGYEGAILRVGEDGYGIGKRSKSLLKIKRVGDEGYEDEEYLVTNITASKDGWGILECTMEDGKTFSVSAPGDMGKKREILENADKYIGKYVQVEYAGYTNDNLPFHPIATMWRNKLEE